MFMLGVSLVLNCVPFWYTSFESCLGLLFGVNSGFLNADLTFSILTAKLTRLRFLRFQCLNDRNNVVTLFLIVYQRFEAL